MDLKDIASFVGQLYAAAKHDLETADPADVGLNGVRIVDWRRAYLEGVKDMAEGIAGRVPEREQFKTDVLAAYEAETARCKDLKE